MGAPRRKKPTGKLNGISLSTYLHEYLIEIVGLETEANKIQTGVARKDNISNQIEKAVAAYVRAYFAKHGQPPKMPGKERTEYVKRLAESNLREFHETLLSKQ